MTYDEIITAMYSGKKILWNDPDLIPGNDYTVTSVSDLYEGADFCTITYGGGSEAQVYLNELEVEE